MPLPEDVERNENQTAESAVRSWEDYLPYACIALTLSALFLFYLCYRQMSPGDLEAQTVSTPALSEVSDSSQTEAERRAETRTELTTSIEETTEPEAKMESFPLPFTDLPYKDPAGTFEVMAGAYGPQRSDYPELLDWIRAMQAEIPPLPEGNYKIRVFLKEQVMAVYQLGTDNVRRLYRVFTASTGEEQGWTPVAKTSIGRRHEEGVMFDGSYAMFCSQINGNILIHSVPSYGDNGHVGISTEDWNKLGTPASHGCVRVAYNVAKFVYENLPQGSPVEVLPDADDFPEIPDGCDRLRLPVDGPAWDPTNPNPENPYIKNPEILIPVNKEIPR